MKRFNTYDEFIVENDNLKLLTKEQLSWCKKHIKGTFSVNNQGEVVVPKGLSFKNPIFDRFPVKFGTVKGNFECVDCENLVSLEGGPKYVRGNFLIRRCPSLESLDGAPTYVRQNFSVDDGVLYEDVPLKNSTRLDGIPKNLYVEGDFIIKSNRLVSLEIVPKTITVEGGYTYISKNLVSLKGAPSHVDGDFSCDGCRNLTSLEGAPAHVGGSFGCGACDIVSLEGAPAYVGGNFKSSRCVNLVSLKGAPAHVGGGFACYYCPKLTSLEGGPAYVGEFSDFHDCHNLTSLEGAPSQVGKKFDLMTWNCPKLPHSFTEIIDDYRKKEIDWKTAHKIIHSESHRAARSLGLL